MYFEAVARGPKQGVSKPPAQQKQQTPPPENAPGEVFEKVATVVGTATLGTTAAVIGAGYGALPKVLCEVAKSMTPGYAVQQCPNPAPTMAGFAIAGGVLFSAGAYVAMKEAPILGEKIAEKFDFSKETGRKAALGVAAASLTGLSALMLARFAGAF